MNKSKKIIVGSFVVSILIVLFLLSLCFVLYHHRIDFMRNSDDVKSNDPKIYQYRSLSKKSNEYSVGFVSSNNDHFDEEGFKFSQDDFSYTLISNIGLPEYKCTGACFCEDDSKERRIASHTSSVLQKGLIYLVASASSLIAYKKAKDYFDRECEESLHNVCSRTFDELYQKLSSEVTKCGVVDEEGEFKTRPKDVKKYYCEGSCLPNIYRSTGEQNFVIPFKCHHHCHDYGCEKLELKTEVDVDHNFWDFQLDEEITENLDDVDVEILEAQELFRLRMLEKFCIENSMEHITVSEFYDCLLSGDEIDEKACKHYFSSSRKEHCKNCAIGKCEVFVESDSKPMCVGMDLDRINPSVKCRRMK